MQEEGDEAGGMGMKFCCEEGTCDMDGIKQDWCGPADEGEDEAWGRLMGR